MKLNACLLRAARAFLDMDQRALSEAAGVSLPTIKRMESQTIETAVSQTTLNKILRFYKTRGILLSEGETGYGIVLT